MHGVASRGDAGLRERLAQQDAAFGVPAPPELDFVEFRYEHPMQCGGRAPQRNSMGAESCVSRHQAAWRPSLCATPFVRTSDVAPGGVAQLWLPTGLAQHR